MLRERIHLSSIVYQYKDYFIMHLLFLLIFTSEPEL